MDVQAMFRIQQQLNDRIIEEHGLQGKSLFAEKILAFFVELGELANETRCFKYWSKKVGSEKEIILEEYVDGLHFVLTLGLALGHTNVTLDYSNDVSRTTTEQFLYVFKCAYELEESQTEDAFQKLFTEFLSLGDQLDFTIAEIEAAYLEKNKVNHQRQDEGY